MNASDLKQMVQWYLTAREIEQARRSVRTHNSPLAPLASFLCLLRLDDPLCGEKVDVFLARIGDNLQTLLAFFGTTWEELCARQQERERAHATFEYRMSLGV